MAGAIAAAVVGGVVLLGGGIWMLTIAFRESSSCGLLYMFIPFYAPYYAITRWSDTKRPFIAGSVGFVLVVGGLVPTLMQFKGEVEGVLMEFMEAGSARDVNAAYACFSSQVDKTELTEFINDNPHLFAEYERVSTSSWEMESSAGITRGYASGAIVYTGDRRLPFEAWLVKENDIWKLTGINIGY